MEREQLRWWEARRIRRAQDVELRSQLVGYISQEMGEALEQRDPNQVIKVKNLAELVLDYGGPGGGPRRLRLDRPRVWLTFILVLCLAVIIGAIVIVSATGNQNTAAAAPYVSIFGGLVGIAVGWLFGSSTSASPRGTQQALERELLDQLQINAQGAGATKPGQESENDEGAESTSLDQESGEAAPKVDKPLQAGG